MHFEACCLDAPGVLYWSMCWHPGTMPVILAAPSARRGPRPEMLLIAQYPALGRLRTSYHTTWSGRVDHAVFASTFTAQFCDVRSRNSCGASLGYNQTIQMGSIFVLGGGGGHVWSFQSSKIRLTFRPSSMKKKNVETQWSLFQALDESDANHV